MKDDNLKPCPFCGGEAEVKTENVCFGHGEYHNKHFVGCKVCGARSSSQIEYDMTTNQCKTIVKEKWNQRTGDSNEKQTPKKPAYEGDGYDENGDLIYDTWICPCCDETYEVDYDNYEYCPKCGQALDWGDSDEQG